MLVLAAAMTLLSAGSASASVRYAEPGGDGPQGNCLQSDPCDIQDAIEDSSVVDGDEVVVEQGEYVIDSVLNVSDAITVHGEPGKPRPTITDTVSDGLSIGHAGAVVRRLRLEGPFKTLLVSADATVEQVFAHSHTNPQPACEVIRGTLRDSVCWASGPATNAVGINLLSGSGTSYAPKLRNVTAIDTAATGYG